MVDPIATKIVEKAVGEAVKQEKPSALSPESSPFKEMLNSMSVGEDLSNLGITPGDLGLPSSQVNAISADGIPIDESRLRIGMTDPNGMEKVVDLLSEVNNGQMKMENLVNEILYSGKRYTNQELLVIQAEVFQVAQATELVVKMADQGVSGAKTVLNTNIQ